jgi:hypothetical protein
VRKIKEFSVVCGIFYACKLHDAMNAMPVRNVLSAAVGFGVFKKIALISAAISSLCVGTL